MVMAHAQKETGPSDAPAKHCRFPDLQHLSTSRFKATVFPEAIEDESTSWQQGEESQLQCHQKNDPTQLTTQWSAITWSLGLRPIYKWPFGWSFEYGRITYSLPQRAVQASKKTPLLRRERLDAILDGTTFKRRE